MDEEEIMSYRSESVHLWFDRRIVLGKSPIHGIGTFAIEAIDAHETIVALSGGLVLTSEDQTLAKVPFAADLYNQEPLGQNQVLITPVSFHYYLNHSCDPNLFYTTTGTFFQFITWRDIEEGEELTLDFGMYGQASLEVCACGSAPCRGRVSVNDWQRPDLQHRYQGYFPFAIQQQIREYERAQASQRPGDE